MKKLTAIVVGAGQRGGIGYATLMKKTDTFDVVAVAEPIESRRNYVRDMHGIPEERCFSHWTGLFELGKIADVAVIATMDKYHLEPALLAIEAGYDILLEKPICENPEDTARIYLAAKKKGVRVVLCTVLRYIPLIMKLKDIVDSGRIGDIMSITHEECVGNIHQSHSFVRGNWGNSKRSSCMLLQKCCHDMDFLQWLIGKKCKKVQSFGHLTYFTEAYAPEGATERCTDGCPHVDTCPYSAIRLYYNRKDNAWFRDNAAGMKDPTDEQVMESLKNGPCGKCVYKTDNDVVDHQVVNMEFEGNVLVNFSMNAFNAGGRFTHIMGTKGEIKAALDGEAPIQIFDIFHEVDDKAEVETIEVSAENTIQSGHGGGDIGIIRAFHAYINGEYDGKSIPTIAESYYNHMLTFAADEARLTGEIVDVDEYIRKIEEKVSKE
ncbi:MAG: Gfo/Idh/MocA family oxidoreductase [Ruminococcaceae bacterium]|nr:Gfo/Idh/MocA family oxidoreductase [Oscillospiraceae bacterium]